MFHDLNIPDSVPVGICLGILYLVHKFLDFKYLVI